MVMPKSWLAERCVDKRTRLQQALALLEGSRLDFIRAVKEGGQEWIVIGLRTADGKHREFIIAQDDEGNGPGALLGLWELAREKGL